MMCISTCIQDTRGRNLSTNDAFIPASFVGNAILQTKTLIIRGSNGSAESSCMEAERETGRMGGGKKNVLSCTVHVLKSSIWLSVD